MIRFCLVLLVPSNPVCNSVENNLVITLNTDNTNLITFVNNNITNYYQVGSCIYRLDNNELTCHQNIKILKDSFE